MATLTFVGGARAWSVAADAHKRAQELEVRQPHLYRQLANSYAVLESQRRMYMDRFRSLEAQIREREQEIAVLRARLVDQAATLVRDRVDERGLELAIHRRRDAGE